MYGQGQFCCIYRRAVRYQVGPLGIYLGLTGFHRTLRDKTLGQQIAVARQLPQRIVQHRLVFGQLRTGFSHIGLIRAGIQREQTFPGFDKLSFLYVYLGDDTVDLRFDAHAGQRGHGANCVQCYLKVTLGRCNRGHRDGRALRAGCRARCTGRSGCG